MEKYFIILEEMTFFVLPYAYMTETEHQYKFISL